MSEFLSNSAERSRIFRAIADAILARTLDKSMAASLQPWIDAATPVDIARLVDSYVVEGLVFSRLKPLVAALLNLFRHPLEAFRYPIFPDAPGSEPFLASLAEEDRAILDILELLKPRMIALKLGQVTVPCAEDEAAPPGIQDRQEESAHDESLGGALGEARSLAGRLSRVETLFEKKENILFPRFESRFPEYRCVRLMWSIQDDARRDIAEFSRLLRDFDDPKALGVAAGRLFFDLSTLVFRDECVLFPLMAELFPEEELEEMYGEAREYGFAFLPEERVEEFDSAFRKSRRDGNSRGPESLAIRGNPQSRERSGAESPTERTALSAVNLGSGSLSAEVLSALFRTIPQDMTFVDASDRVAFFTDSPHRIFPRSRSILGRLVADCHPQESVGRVLRIVEGFRSGAGDSESFWLSVGRRFVHIEYRALRSPDGSYLGTLEISEDLTDKRNLSGEKRL
jgi:hypothetical protein